MELHSVKPFYTSLLKHLLNSCRNKITYQVNQLHSTYSTWTVCTQVVFRPPCYSKATHMNNQEPHQFGFLDRFQVLHNLKQLHLADVPGHKPLCSGWCSALHSVQLSRLKLSHATAKSTDAALTGSFHKPTALHHLSTLFPIQDYSVNTPRDNSHNPAYPSILSQPTSFAILHLPPLL